MNDPLLAGVRAVARLCGGHLAGLFSRLAGRPSPLVSWPADASYRMHLVHVPLVMHIPRLPARRSSKIRLVQGRLADVRGGDT